MKTLFLALAIIIATIPTTTASLLIPQPDIHSNLHNRTMLDQAELELELRVLKTTKPTEKQVQDLINLEKGLNEKRPLAKS